MTESQPIAAKVRPTCKCGFDRKHHLVTAENEYSFFDKILVMIIGTTCVPIRTQYKCRQCNEIFDETTDPAELRQNI